jgi:peroxiredoxin
LHEEGCSAIFGFSTQPTDYQKEVVTRLQLPFPLLSDNELILTKDISIPTFEIEKLILTKRTTLIIENGTILKVFYPVFPPADSANEVLKWFKANK